MSVLNFLTKKVDVSNRKSDKNEESLIYENDEANSISKKTLEELAIKGDTYWKFSQSVRGRSVENHFIDYIEGTIITAEDCSKYLSFVPQSHIALCSMYGDTLTKFSFDLNDPLFDKIKDEQYTFYNSVLMEYDAKRLVVEKNYSLSDIETIGMVIEMSSCWDQITNFIYGLPNYIDCLHKRLESYGYTESAAFVEYLEKNYNFYSFEDTENVRKNIHRIIENYNNDI